MGVWDRFWSKVNKEGICWEWAKAFDPTGYGAFKIDGKKKGAHCVAWELVNGSIPVGFEVCHHCDNPKCVHPLHLFIGTRQDNMRDCSSKDRIARTIPKRLYYGETHHNSKLTDNDVREIRSLYANGTRPVDIMERFNTPRNTIQNIIYKKRRTHL